VLNQAAQGQFAYGGALPGLSVAEATGGEGQEVAVLSQRRQQVGALAVGGG